MNNYGGEYTVTIMELRGEIDGSGNYPDSYDFGLANYPIFPDTPERRAELNKKILDHYMLEEIGFKVEGAFKFRLNAVMEKIMPYYNNLIEKQLLITNPFLQIERTNVQAGKVENDAINKNTVDSNVDGTSKEVSSKTPKQLIEVIDLNADVYGDDARRSESNDKQDVITDTIINAETNTLITVTESGRGVSQSQLYREYIEVIENYDEVIISRLTDLFMGVL